MTLEVDSSDTIQQVKAKILLAEQAAAAGRTAGCACRMRLQYGQHTELADGRTLAAYGIQQWSTLDLRVSRVRCLPTCAVAVSTAGTGAGAGVAAVEASPATLPIIFQDEHFVAVSKPAGLLVHPTPEARGATDTVLRRLESQLGVPKLWPVHRLDRGTSGALVLALSSAAAAALSAQWQDHPDHTEEHAESAVPDAAVSKEYLALVAGATAESFESREPLTNRRIQSKAARRKKKRDRAEAVDLSSGGEFDLETIPDIAKRRYVAALVALCDQAGGSATIAALAEQCRAEDFGLPAGTGLRATVSEWPKLWAIRQEGRSREGGKVRVVRLLRPLKSHDGEVDGETSRSKRQRHKLAQDSEKSEQERQTQRKQHGDKVDTYDTATVATVAPAERQAAHTIFRRLATSSACSASGSVEHPEQLTLSLLVANLKTGRRHQIRRHLSKLRTPIVGDAEHGMGQVNRPLRGLGLQRPFLHAFRLSFEHPMREDDRRVIVNAPLTSDLTAFLRAAGLMDLSAAVDAELRKSGE
jgi:23S rRNA-/tRNA-specific pseudouridylate synthase